MSPKVSVSLPDDDLAFLDRQTLSGAFDSRSAALQAAVSLLRREELADAYAEAFGTWGDQDAEAWDSAASDGLAAS